MLLDYDTIITVLPFENLANRCGKVESLHARTSDNHEYGISWDDFLTQYQNDCIPLIKDWLEEVDDEEILKWIKDYKQGLECRLERINSLLNQYEKES